jgi:hypothetical protein
LGKKLTNNFIILCELPGGGGFATLRKSEFFKAGGGVPFLPCHLTATGELKSLSWAMPMTEDSMRLGLEKA